MTNRLTDFNKFTKFISKDDYELFKNDKNKYITNVDGFEITQSTFYSKINHFLKILKMYETDEIPYSLLKLIEIELIFRNITIDNLKIETIVDILKERKYFNDIERAFQIYYKLKNVEIKFTEKEIDTLINDFKKINSTWPKKSTILSFRYIIYKLCQKNKIKIFDKLPFPINDKSELNYCEIIWKDINKNI